MSSRSSLKLLDFITHADFFCAQVTDKGREFVVEIPQASGIAEVLIANNFEQIAALGKPDNGLRFLKPSFSTFVTEDDYEYDEEEDKMGVASEIDLALKRAASGESVSFTVNGNKVYMGNQHMITPSLAP